MRVAIILLSTVTALAVQAKVNIFSVSPNITVIVAYYLGIRRGTTEGILFGSLIGIIEDSVGGTMLGPNLLAKGAVGFLSAFVSGTLFRWTPFLGVLSVFFLTAGDGIMRFLSRSVFDVMPGSLSLVVTTTVVQGLLNAGAGIFIKPKHAE